jgi:hypothetical protein
VTDAKSAEVRRILNRYLVEVVEAYDLCPWARSTRRAGEVAVGIVWDTPSVEAWVSAATAALATPKTQIAMIVAPQLSGDPAELRAIRDAVALQVPSAGVAHFHPEAPLDLTTPARLVPFVRRSPDRLLQLVPLAILERVRVVPQLADRALQAQILRGTIPPPREDVAERIARENHAQVSSHLARIVATLGEIASDRHAAYVRVGIS